MVTTYHIVASGNYLQRGGEGGFGNTIAKGMTELETICAVSKWQDGPIVWKDKKERKVRRYGEMNILPNMSGSVIGNAIQNVYDFMKERGYTFLKFNEAYSTITNEPRSRAPFDVGTGIFLPEELANITEKIFSGLVKNDKFGKIIPYEEIGLDELNQHQVGLLYRSMVNTPFEDLLKIRIAYCLVESIEKETKNFDDVFGRDWHDSFKSVSLRNMDTKPENYLATLKEYLVQGMTYLQNTIIMSINDNTGLISQANMALVHGDRDKIRDIQVILKKYEINRDFNTGTLL